MIHENFNEFLENLTPYGILKKRKDQLFNFKRGKLIFHSSNRIFYVNNKEVLHWYINDFERTSLRESIDFIS